jgi:high-affinity nickel-transport protein
MQSELLLFTNVFLLGLRHGFDWDHLAALSDIVGTSTAGGAATAGAQTIKLSTCYIVGHATVVVLLGVAVILAGNFMPQWLDAIMERAVGLTLIGLAGWLVYSIVRRTRSHSHEIRSYGVATTFGVGMIHGITAETGTQMLLLASIGGAHNPTLAMCLLMVFVIGLLISNSAIAMAGIAGFTAARFGNAANSLGFATAAFSVAVGVKLLL